MKQAKKKRQEVREEPEDAERLKLVRSQRFGEHVRYHLRDSSSSFAQSTSESMLFGFPGAEARCASTNP
jgi:hypothetical protein